MNNYNDAPKPFIVFDLDGTICANGHRIDWTNPVSVSEKCRPFQLATRRFAALHEAGDVNLGVLTARGPNLQAVTWKQLVEWLGPVADALDVFHQPEDRNGIAWQEFREMIVQHKAGVLLEMDATCYVGDSLWDRTAAEIAGVPFLWAHEFRAGARIPGIVIQTKPEARAA